LLAEDDDEDEDVQVRLFGAWRRGIDI